MFENLYWKKKQIREGSIAIPNDELMKATEEADTNRTFAERLKDVGETIDESLNETDERAKQLSGQATMETIQSDAKIQKTQAELTELEKRHSNLH